MKKLAMIGVAILCMSALSAQAANPGTYLGAGLGYGKQDTPNGSFLNKHFPDFKNTNDTGVLGGRLFAGYNFNEYFGLEAGFTHYASSTTKASYNQSKLVTVKRALDYRMNTLDLVGKAYLPVGQGVNLYGLGGIARVGSEMSLSGSDAIPTANSLNKSSTLHRIRPIYGAGISYDIPQTNLTTNLEYSHIQGSGNLKTSSSAIPGANLVSLNLSYNFG